VIVADAIVVRYFWEGRWYQSPARLTVRRASDKFHSWCEVERAS
jgi:hypothetical protein